MKRLGPPASLLGSDDLLASCLTDLIDRLGATEVRSWLKRGDIDGLSPLNFSRKHGNRKLLLWICRNRHNLLTFSPQSGISIGEMVNTLKDPTNAPGVIAGRKRKSSPKPLDRKPKVKSTGKGKGRYRGS